MGYHASLADVLSVASATFKHPIGPFLFVHDPSLVFKEFNSFFHSFRTFFRHNGWSAAIPFEPLSHILIFVKLKVLQHLFKLLHEAWWVLSDIVVKFVNIVVHLRDPCHIWVVVLHKYYLYWFIKAFINELNSISSKIYFEWPNETIPYFDCLDCLDLLEW